MKIYTVALSDGRGEGDTLLVESSDESNACEIARAYATYNWDWEDIEVDASYEGFYVTTSKTYQYLVKEI